MGECIKNLYYIKNKIEPVKGEILAEVIAKVGGETTKYKDCIEKILSERYSHLSPLERSGITQFILSKSVDIFDQLLKNNRIVGVNQYGTNELGGHRVYFKFHLLMAEPDGQLCAVVFQDAKDLKIIEESKTQGKGKIDSITAGKFFTVFDEIDKLLLISINPKSKSRGKILKFITVLRDEVNTALFFDALQNQELNCNLCDKKVICDYQDSLNLLQKSIFHEGANASTRWYLPSLNKEQEAVTRLRTGVGRVIACPGSGKTTTIIKHCKNLIDEGYAGEQILFLSFSKNAVRELRDRFNKMANTYYKKDPFKLYEAGNVQFLNYNGLGDLAAKEDIHGVFTDEPKVISKVDALVILENIIENSNTDMDLPASYDKPFAKYGVCMYLYNKINNAKLEMVDCIAKGITYTIPDEIKFYFEAYEAEKKAQNYIDYNDQLIILMDYLNHSSYDYRIIFIDEAQDSNNAHLSILKRLQENTEGMFFVGDPGQSIYSFNNVYPDNMLNLHKIFENVKDLRLSTNYRSCDEIINASNTILNYSQIPLQMSMSGVNPGGITKTIPISDKNDIVDFYIKNIPPDSDVMVLCANNEACKKVSASFMNQLIPVSLDYAITNDLLYALKCAVSAIVFKEINYVPYALAILKMKHIKEINEREIKDTFTELLTIGQSNEAYSQLREYFNRLCCIPINIDIFEILDNAYINDLASAFTYLRIYLDSSDVERKSIISHIGNDNQNPNSRVRVSTIHMAKGSEAPIVIIDGTSLRSTAKTPINDEDLRQLYVAFTRAEKELYFMHDEELSEKKQALQYYAYCAISESTGTLPMREAI